METRVVVGVDIDGVIAEQVPYLLKRVRRQSGICMKKREVKQWNQPIDSHGFAYHMEKALLDHNFILTMPLVRGAREAMLQLSKDFRVVIVTSRPSNTDDKTIEWLSKKRISFHQYINAREKGKCEVPVDILVDDRPENVHEVAAAGRDAILFLQPWNANTILSGNTISRGVILRAKGWANTLKCIDYLSSQR